MSIGEIKDVEAGKAYVSRQALHDDGIHRPLQAGICGTAKEGAESIVLSECK
jgi:putative restriction endonuclease